MALFRKFFYRKPPDGLLEISERVYVFDCCFAIDILQDHEYKVYMGDVVGQLRDYFHDASFVVFNFCNGENQSQIAGILSQHDITVMNYPRQYKNCPLLTMEMIHHFLKSSESWLSLGQRNMLLMHCEQDGWPLLAFMLAAFLIYRKQYTGEQKTLDMIYKQTSRELLQLMLPLDPLPSQLRYLQYVSRRNVGSEWPPLVRALTLDCIILRFIPDMDGEGGCRPIFRIYGPDPFMTADRTPKVLFSTSKKSQIVRYYKQADCELVKIDIHCHIQGDVILECITLDCDLEREEIMFRIVFNTAFIRSNILILNRDEIDTLWNAKDQFSKDFRAEVLFSEMDSSSSLVMLDLPVIEDKGGLPIEAFAKVQEMFSDVDWLDQKADVALNMLQRTVDIPQEKLETFDGAGKEKSDKVSSQSATKKILESGSTGSAEKENCKTALLQSARNEYLDSVPTEALAKVQETFSNVGWLDPKSDVALNVFQITASNMLQEKLENVLAIGKQKLNASSPRTARTVFLESGSPDTAINNKVEKAYHHSDRKESDSLSPQVNNEGTVFQESIVDSIVETSNSGALVNDVRRFLPTVLEEQSVVSSKSVSDFNSMTNKMKSQELHAASQRPLLSESVSLQIPQASQSNPASYSNSLVASPAPLTKYQSEASAIGITALLHDDAKLNNKVGPHVVTLSPKPALSASFPHLCKPVSPSFFSVVPASELPPSSHLAVSTATKVSATASSPPPPPAVPPLPVPLKNSLKSPPPPPPLPPSPSSSRLVPVGTITNLHLTSPPAPERDSANAPVPSSLQEQSSAIATSRHPLPAPAVRSVPDSRATATSSEPHPPALDPTASSSGKSLSLNVRDSSSIPTVCLSPLPGTASSSGLISLITAENNLELAARPPPPPPPPPNLGSLSSPAATSSKLSPLPPCQATSTLPLSPPPLPGAASSSGPISVHVPEENSKIATRPPPPPPPPSLSMVSLSSAAPSLAHPLPPPLPPKKSTSISQRAPPVPPPLAPFSNTLPKAGTTSPSHSASHNGNIPPTPAPPLGPNGRLQIRATSRNQSQTKKASLKPYHWLKLTRVMQGSLWAEAQKPEEASKTPEFDMSELESLFSASVTNSNNGSSGRKSSRASRNKSDIVNLIDLRRAYNCEIMLTKVKVPLPDLMSSVLALDDSALDVDQVDTLIKFCPNKEEIELLQNYKGDKENLGKCEKFFLELMKVPRAESKLRVFSFKIQFCSQVSDLRNSLNLVNSAAEEVRNSVKLKRIMQTILSLGNALNHGTARGSAVGFRLDSLLKLTDTRARNNKMTLMHYLCKVIAEKLPELLDFPNDLVSLEAATKVQLKYLAEEMQAISKGLEKVVQELAASENDGPVSENFCKILKEFLSCAETEVRSLASIYSGVGRNADALAFYFGEDPARCPFEQVVSTLLNFVRMFVRAHEENCKQLEFEKKRAQKDAENERTRSKTSIKEWDTVKKDDCKIPNT